MNMSELGIEDENVFNDFLDNLKDELNNSCEYNKDLEYKEYEFVNWV